MEERIISFFIKKYFLDYTDVIISIFFRAFADSVYCTM